MKFITEEDLRDLYKKQPFTDYDLKEGERLTPGARQFLVDRGVDMYDRNDPMAVLDAQKKEKAKAAQAAKTESSSGCRNGKKLCAKHKSRRKRDCSAFILLQSFFPFLHPEEDSVLAA